MQSSNNTSFFIVLNANPNQGNALQTTFERSFNLQCKWEVGITRLNSAETRNAYIMCNLVDYTFIQSQWMRFLDYLEISNPTVIAKPNYVKVVNKKFSNMNIDIIKDFPNGIMTDPSLVCVLHFRKS